PSAAEAGRPWWGLTPVTSAEESATEEDDAVVVGAVAADTYRGDTERALADIKGWLHDNWSVVLVTQGQGPAERLVSMLRDSGLGASLTDDLVEAPRPAVATVTTGLVDHGFPLRPVRTAGPPETDLAGQ